jgi:hypothetical protein
MVKVHLHVRFYINIAHSKEQYIFAIFKTHYSLMRKWTHRRTICPFIAFKPQTYTAYFEFNIGL